MMGTSSALGGACILASTSAGRVSATCKRHQHMHTNMYSSQG
jgi:hypothetical protein